MQAFKRCLYLVTAAVTIQGCGPSQEEFSDHLLGSWQHENNTHSFCTTYYDDGGEYRRLKMFITSKKDGGIVYREGYYYTARGMHFWKQSELIYDGKGYIPKEERHGSRSFYYALTVDDNSITYRSAKKKDDKNKPTYSLSRVENCDEPEARLYEKYGPRPDETANSES